MKTSAPSLKFETLGTCLVCGNAERRTIFAVDQAVLYECRNCHFRYFDPCISQASMGRIYESSEHLGGRDSVHSDYYEYGDLLKRTKTLRDFEKGLILLQKGLGAPQKPKLFEIGFGSGLFLALAQKKGWHADGLETSGSNVKLAREKFGITLRQGDLFREQLPDHFDAVAAWDVLEHQNDPHHFLKRLGSLLKPQGLLLVAVPNDLSFLRLLSSFLYRLSFGRMDQGMRRIYLLEHIGYYNRRTLSRLLEAEGFQIESGFFSSTDLARYQFKPLERLSASAILSAGKILGLENRLILIARKIS